MSRSLVTSKQSSTTAEFEELQESKQTENDMPPSAAVGARAAHKEGVTLGERRGGTQRCVALQLRQRTGVTTAPVHWIVQRKVQWTTKASGTNLIMI